MAPSLCRRDLGNGNRGIRPSLAAEQGGENTLVRAEVSVPVFETILYYKFFGDNSERRSLVYSTKKICRLHQDI